MFVALGSFCRFALQFGFFSLFLFYQGGRGNYAKSF
jgi:hypothetical protein